MQGGTLFVSCLLYWTYVSALRIPLTEDFIQVSERAQLVVSDHAGGSQVRNRRDVSSFPDKTNVTIQTTSRGELTLDLQISENIHVNMPVYVMRDGQIRREPSETLQNIAVYRDNKKGASILLERVNSGTRSSSYNVFGSFHTDEGMFVIQPHEQQGHVVSHVPKQRAVYEMEPLTEMFKESAHKKTNPTGRVKRQATNNLIEVFIITDYEIYNLWYAMTSGSNRDQQTRQLIQQYMAYLLNEVDMRYANIGRSDYSIGILNAGLFIADTPNSATWSESNKYLESSEYRLPSSVTLDSFRDWVNENSLPSNDHVMGITGYDLASSGGSTDSSGIAYTGALCTSSSVSLVEDHLTFISMTTATHELGHSLGAVHDGDGNICDSNDNYVMSVVNRVTDEPVIGTNLWLFSPCSKDAFKSYIDRLFNNCMQSTSATSEIVTVDTPMAELYPPDRTCEYAIGDGSYVCRSIQNYTTICSSMYCNEPGTTQCYSVLPAEGTPCGNGKWCENGVCIPSPDAPTDIRDECPIGDHPNVIDNLDKTCTEMVRDSPDQCYNSYISKLCCDSCPSINTGIAGCEYGDKNRNFCSGISRFGCYSNEDLCCDTCAALKNNQIPGCEFGDKFSGCRVQDCPFYNEANRAGCCETCFDGTTVSTTPTTTTSSTTTTTTSTSTTTTTTTTVTTKTKKPVPTTTESKQPTTITTPVISTTQSSTVSGTTNITVVVTPTEDKKVSDIVVVGVGIAAGAIILITVLVLVCIIRKRRQKNSKKSGSNGTYDNIGFVENAPNRPPPRRVDSSIRSQPPTKPTKPVKPSAPVYPLTAHKSDVDGYMMPGNQEVKTISNGVMYTAPDKSAIKVIVSDQQQRNSKTIHYKRSSAATDTKTLVPDQSLLTSSNMSTKPTQDTYDSIGHVEGERQGQGHRPIPPKYHKPYNGISPRLPDRPSSNHQNKPELPTKRIGKPLLPSIKPDKLQTDNHNNSGLTNNHINIENDISNHTLHVHQTTAPKPMPRPKRNRTSKDNQKSDTGNHGDVYDTADPVQVQSKKFPLQPPARPVPRRKPCDTIDNHVKQGTENTAYDSDDFEIQI